MIYTYILLCSAWTLKHMVDEIFCVERGALENTGKLMFCVEKEALEHMSLATFVLSMKLWNTMKI